MRLIPARSQRLFGFISSTMALWLLAVIVTCGVQAKDETQLETSEEQVEERVFDPTPATKDPVPLRALPNDIRLEGFGSDREPLQPVPNPIGAVVFDEPVPGSPAWLSGLFCPLPARIEMLASESPDAAETEKLRTLRESFEAVLKEKASLLNADALTAEIELQRRQVTELQALRELETLQRSLKELSDKFPDSKAGKRALEVLDLLKQRSGQRGLNLLPTPDLGNPNRAPTFIPDDPSTLTPPRRHPEGDFAIPRRKPVKPEEQPIQPKFVPDPTDGVKRPIP